MPVSFTTADNSKYHLHYDQVGSLRAVTDTSNTIIKEIVYDTYGNILEDTNPDFSVPFGFAGGLYDQDTGLTRFGYRDYDSYTGKWTAKDPIDFAGGDTNLYGYELADPVNFVDPLGLHGEKCLSDALVSLWNQKSDIGSDIVEAYSNAHPAAKASLAVASSFTVGTLAVTGSEAAVAYAINNPTKTIQFVRGVTSGNPTTSTATSKVEATGFIIRQILELVK